MSLSYNTEYNTAMCRGWRQVRELQGLCNRCGKRKTDNETKYCRKCRRVARGYSERYRERRRILERLGK
jgi:hypothetical protein